jgi:transposase InsO family protein
MRGNLRDCPLRLLSNLKNELVHHHDFASREHARAGIFDYIEVFYNRACIHQTLGYRTPDEVEKQWLLYA